MGLDSVEIVIGWEQSFDISISDAEAMALRTPRQAIELISSKLGVLEDPRRACLTQRAFHLLRRSITGGLGVPRHRVRPETRLRDLTRGKHGSGWEAVRSACGVKELPGLGWFSPRTVGDLTHWAVANAASVIKGPGKKWSYQEVRSVVHAVLREVSGVGDFTDDDDFIRDLGID